MIASWARKYVDDRQDKRKKPALGDNRVVVRTGASGYRTEILANGHPLVADEPESVGGTNAGPTPYELLAAALGACTTMTLRMYADRKGWPLEAVTARLAHQKVHREDSGNADSTGSRIDRLSHEITVEGPLDDEQRRRLLEIAARCPVHRTLHSDVEVETSMVDDQ
jgi:putative redox protein